MNTNRTKEQDRSIEECKRNDFSLQENVLYVQKRCPSVLLGLRQNLIKVDMNTKETVLYGSCISVEK